MLEKFSSSRPTNTDSRNINRISFFIIAVPYEMNEEPNYHNGIKRTLNGS